MPGIETHQFTPLAYRIKDFCRAVGISLRTFYTLKNAGKAPDMTKIGGRLVIRRTVALEWLEKQETMQATDVPKSRAKDARKATLSS